MAIPISRIRYFLEHEDALISYFKTFDLNLYKDKLKRR